MKWSGSLPVVRNNHAAYQWLKQPRNQQRRILYMKWSGNLPVVKTTTLPTATESLHEMGLETYQWLKQPRNQQRRNLYVKWSGNLPLVNTITLPTATESLHEMVWKLTSG